jgi:tripartite-type tricarboxylate transporter receptor subunit TctC
MQAMFRGALLALAFCVAAAATAVAQAPSGRTVTIVVPFPAGGPLDLTARLLGEHMGATLGQQFVVENVTGAGGTLGTGRVARAAPDGTTLLIHQIAIAASPALYPKLPFDTEKELTGIGLANTSPMVIIGRTGLPANSMAELAAWMKQPGQNVKFAHAGAGTLAHLCAALLAQSVGTSVNLIPYRGGAPATNDVVAGHADLFCSSPTTAVQQIQENKVKGFGVTSAQPMPAIPQVPSLVQLGYQEMELQFWQAVFAPAATPKPVIDRLNEAMQRALADPKMIKAFADTGNAVFPQAQQTPEAANALFQSEVARWGKVVRANKLEITQ